MDDVERTFFAAPPVIKARMGIDVPLAMGDGWDIGPLKKLGGGAAVDVEFGGNATLGTGTGALTVQVVTSGKPNVYYGGSVNYVLWGKVLRLLHDTLRNPITGAYNPKFSESAAAADAWLYKSGYIRDFSMTKTEAIAFVRYGYSGTDPSSTALLPIATEAGNVANPRTGRFSWKWLDLRNDEE